MDRFADRKVIITGAGSGIGRATVLRMLDEGARIAAFDVSGLGLAETAEEAKARDTVGRLQTGLLDIASEHDVVEQVKGAVTSLGGLDVLVNAAAIQTCSHTHEQSLQDWNRTLAVNLTGTFLMTREALPALCASGRGVVVNFSSTSAQFAHPYVAAYAASKGGILAFTHALALEYADQGLRAVNIQPGGTATNLARSTVAMMPAGWKPALYAKQSPILGGGSLGDPAAVASVVAMVASDDGASITGTEIRVDGGAHA